MRLFNLALLLLLVIIINCSYIDAISSTRIRVEDNSEQPQSQSQRYEFTEKDDSSSEWFSLLSTSNKVVSGKFVKGAVASGYFKDDVMKDGWGKLSIETISGSDNEIFQAAGYLEGYLTWKHIYNFTNNYYYGQFNTTNPKEFPTPVWNYIVANYEWTMDQVKANPTDPYWAQVNNSFTQLNGLVTGYNDAADSDKQFTFMDFLMVNLIGDIGDIMAAVNGTNNNEFKPMSRADVEEYMATTGRCSALVKVTPDFSDLFVAHTTWGSYYNMLRIFKRIKIVSATTPNGYESLFSSYPGVLVSDDDFYIIRPSQLVVTETTNSILNMTIYNKVTPQCLMYWVRNLVANRLSNSGQEWVQYFEQYNSGTYNNQFMVVDYKLFTPYKDLQPNTLWIIEQMPGACVSADVTQFLSLGYWPSYNRPFFPEVFEAMGYPWYLNKYGDIFSYALNPRSNIFRRDQSTVYSLTDMQAIMTSNMYKVDPFSDGYPGNAIASRYDLGGGPPILDWYYKGAHGAIDSKITSSSLVPGLQCVAISGPPVTGDCPPFSWANGWDYIPHDGLPDTFNFPWVDIDL